MKCDNCGTKISVWSTGYRVGNGVLCSDCHKKSEVVEHFKQQASENGKQEKQGGGAEKVDRVSKSMMTTTPSFPEYETVRSLGPVFGEAILGSNVFSDIFASVRDVVGGRSNSYQKRFNEGREMALEDMGIEAKRQGGNAIVGVKVDYEMVRDTMMMVSATGTAVIVQEPQVEVEEED